MYVRCDEVGGTLMESHKRCLDRFASNDKAECKQREPERKYRVKTVANVVEVKGLAGRARDRV